MAGLVIWGGGVGFVGGGGVGVEVGPILLSDGCGGDDVEGAGCGGGLGDGGDEEGGGEGEEGEDEGGGVHCGGRVGWEWGCERCGDAKGDFREGVEERKVV